MSRGPCNVAATRSFGHNPGAFPMLHRQRLHLIRRRGLVDCLSPDQHRVSYLYVRGFDISLVVCLTFYLNLLLKIPPVQLFKVVLTRSNSNGKPGTELAVRVHQVCLSDHGGAVWRCPIGTEGTCILPAWSLSPSVCLTDKASSVPSWISWLPHWLAGSGVSFAHDESPNISWSHWTLAC